MTAPLLAALAFLCVAMTGAWAVQRKTGNSGWIDTIWSFSVGAASLLSLAMMATDGARRILLAMLIALWSVRLGWHILTRTRLGTDDPRYAALMQEWGASASLRLFLFLQVQALAGIVLVGAVVLAAASSSSATSAGTILLAILATLAIAGEGISDAQLAECKKNKPKNGICETGFWACSRHPTYFFEWLFWLSIAGIAVAPPSGFMSFLALGAPAMMYALLRYGSGVPHLEAHMMRTRPEAFAEYAGRVPVFFPKLGCLKAR